MFSVHIRQAQRSIDVELGATILQAALSQGIDYPHGCRAGNCGACKSRLHAGDVELSPYSEFALAKSEFEDSFILACRAVPWSDCEVSWCELEDAQSHPVRTLRCRVEQVEHLTKDIVSVKLSLLFGNRLSFNPGQFVIATFQGLPGREYSIANSPDSELLEFYVRRIAGGAVSPFIANHLKPGEPVTIEGPFGIMYYREEREGPILALAGGSGLSAIQPIVIESLRDKPDREIWLYHGVRDESDIFRQELFESLALRHRCFSYVPVLSQPSKQTGCRVGMLASVVASDFSTVEEFTAYMAGPPPMIDSCTETLRNKGILEGRIFADPFFTEADRI